MPTDPLVLVLAAVLSLAVGLLMGVIGGGGSFVYLLLLLIVAGVQPQLAIGTGVVLGAVGSLAATTRHVRAGSVRWRTAAWLAALAMPAAVAGATLTTIISERVLIVLVVAATAVLGLLPLVGLRTVREDQPTTEPADGTEGVPGRRVWWRLPVGLVLGTGTGAFGMAGGAPLAGYLATVERVRPLAAVGTAMAVVTLASTGAAVGHIALHQVSWPWAAALCSGAIIGSYAGAALVARIPQRVLMATLGVLSLLTSIGLVVNR